MKTVSKLGLSLYGLALLRSLTGASMLLSGFLIAADWNYGIHAAMVAYFLISSFGTLGLLFATALFWSSNPIVIRIGLISNIETLMFSSLLAGATLLDKNLDTSPMVVGLDRSMSLSVSVVAWLMVPVFTSLTGTCASFWRRNSGRGSKGLSSTLEAGSSAYPSG